MQQTLSENAKLLGLGEGVFHKEQVLSEYVKKCHSALKNRVNIGILGFILRARNIPTMNILVSGGTKGIGRAIVKKFAQQGFGVAFYSKNPDNLKSLKEELLLSNPDTNIYCAEVDAADTPSVKNFAADALKQLGHFDVLVNNVGIFKPGQILSEQDGVLEHLLQVNVASAYHLTRAVLPDMLKQKKGHVFNICSTASIIPYVNGGSYCISKFALLGMSKVLREELKETNVRVTAVLPGATYTESWSSSNLPEDRFIQPEDISAAIWSCYQLSSHAVVEELLIRPQLGDI